MRLFKGKTISDRKSKFQASAAKIQSEEDVKKTLKLLESKKKFQKATHNIYAYRIKAKTGRIYERKNDDGETGAGIILLKLLQDMEIVNFIIIVSRWYGGVHLGGDRFKHVKNLAIDLIKTIFPEKSSQA